MTLSRNAIGNLINRYKAVLGKCRMLNTFGSLAVAGIMVLGGSGMAWGADLGALGVADGDSRIISGANTATSMTIRGTLTSDGSLDVSGNSTITKNGTVITNNSLVISGTTWINGTLDINNGTTSLKGTVETNHSDTGPISPASHIAVSSELVTNVSNVSELKEGSFVLKGDSKLTLTNGSGTNQLNLSTADFSNRVNTTTGKGYNGQITFGGRGATIDVFEDAATNTRGNATVSFTGTTTNNTLNLYGNTIKANSFDFNPTSTAGPMTLTDGTLHAEGNASVINITSGSALVLDDAVLNLDAGSTSGSGGSPTNNHGDIRGSLVLAGTKRYELVVESGNWDVSGSIDGNNKKGNLTVKNGATLTANGGISNVGTIDATHGDVSSGSGITVRDVFVDNGHSVKSAGSMTIDNKVTAGVGTGIGTIEATSGNLTLSGGIVADKIDITAGNTLTVGGSGNVANNVTATTLDVSSDKPNSPNKLTANTVTATHINAKNSHIIAKTAGFNLDSLTLTDDSTVEAKAGNITIAQQVRDANGSVITRDGDITLTYGATISDTTHNIPQLNLVAENVSGSGNKGNISFGTTTTHGIRSHVASVEAANTVTVYPDHRPLDDENRIINSLTVTDHLYADNIQAGTTNVTVDGSINTIPARIDLNEDSTSISRVNDLTLRRTTGDLGNTMYADNVSIEHHSDIVATNLGEPTSDVRVIGGSSLHVIGRDGHAFQGNLYIGNPTGTDQGTPSLVAIYNPGNNDSIVTTENPHGKMTLSRDKQVTVGREGIVAFGIDLTQNTGVTTLAEREKAFSKKISESMARATREGVGTTVSSAVYLDKPMGVEKHDRLTTYALRAGTFDSSNPVPASVALASDAVLVVNADNSSETRPFLYGVTRDDLDVKDAHLDVVNAVQDQTIAILASDVASATDFANGRNVTTDNILVKASYKDGLVTTGQTGAKSAMPGIDGKLAGLMDRAQRAREIGSSLDHVDSNQGGVRFLSRAITKSTIDGREFLGNSPAEASKAVESAARMGTVAAVPQLAVAANDLGTDAISQRTSIAMPTGSMTAIGISGGDDTAGMSAGEPYGQDGVGLWVMPLYQSTNGQGMKAGDRKVDFDGSLGGVAAGIDYTVADTARVGVTFNMGSGETKGSGSLASTTNKMKFWGVGAYVGVMAEEMAFTADVSYTATSNDIKQKGNPKMGMGDLKADVKAQAIGAGVRAEYRYRTEAVDIIPHVGVRYTNITTDEYDVKAGGMKVMKADGSNQSIWSFPVGVQISRETELSNGWYVKPSLDLNITPSLGDVEAKNDIRFTGVSDKATMQAQTMDQITYGGQVGLEVGNDAVQLGINYSLQMGEKTTNHGVFGTFRYNF